MGRGKTPVRKIDDKMQTHNDINPIKVNDVKVKAVTKLNTVSPIGVSIEKTKGNKTLFSKGLLLISYIDKVFFGELSAFKVKRLLIYFSIISILEVIAYLYKGIFSILAVRCWLVTGLLCFIAILVPFVKTVIQDIKEKQFLSLSAVFLLFLLLTSFWGNINLADINPDATQQAAAGLEAFQSSDFNYTGKAFLGYPARQYLLTAIPALIFGRSIVTLHMGFAFPFILGLMLLYSAFHKWAKRMYLNTNITVLPLYAFLVFPYITEYYTNFEQSFYPIAFTMLGIGFFLLTLSEPSVAYIISLAWIGGLYSNSYTPVMATLGLLIVFVTLAVYLFYYMPNKLPFRVEAPRLVGKAMLMLEVNVLVFMFATFLDKRQDKISELRKDTDLIKIVGKSIYEFLTDKHAVFLGMFGIVVIAYLIGGLSLRLKLRDFLLSSWILGVVVASNMMIGYTNYEPAWIMQRMMIVIPVFLTGLTLTLFDFINKHNWKVAWGTVVVFAVAFSFIGITNFKQINQSFTYFNYIQPLKYMWEDLEETVMAEGLNEESGFNLVLYTDNILMKNPADYCKFFYPNAKVYTPELGSYPSDIDSSLQTFLYGDGKLPDIISTDQMEVRSYESKKYEMTITWFKGVIK